VLIKVADSSDSRSDTVTAAIPAKSSKFDKIQMLAEIAEIACRSARIVRIKVTDNLMLYVVL
jgi:hypothetical protein